MSFNKIKHIKRVNQLVELRNLYFVQNKITRIEGLEGLVHLRNLELGANKIRVRDPLGGRVVKGPVDESRNWARGGKLIVV